VFFNYLATWYAQLKLVLTANYNLSEVALHCLLVTAVVLRISAICRRHTRNNSHEVNDENILLPLTLICDNIRDAGTLGTLIRSAAAACCRTMLITRGNYYRLRQGACVFVMACLSVGRIAKKWTEFSSKKLTEFVRFFSRGGRGPWYKK